MKPRDLKKLGLNGKRSRRILARVLSWGCLRTNLLGQSETCRDLEQKHKTTKNMPGLLMIRHRVRAWCPICEVKKQLERGA